MRNIFQPIEFSFFRSLIGWIQTHFFKMSQTSFQVAQNQVKVATDGSICADTTFVQTPLKIFLFTLRLRSRYLKGTPELVLYASKKNWDHTVHRSDYIEGKVKYTVISEIKHKLGWKFLINPSFLWSNFFQNALENFSSPYDHVQGM